METKIRSYISIFLIVFILINAFGLTVYAAQETTPFDDISEESWYYESVSYAYENGILVGVSENTFSPHGELTRAMAVQMLYSIAGKPDDGISWGCPYDDVSEDSWYRKAVIWAHQNGITNGVGDRKFAPYTPVTRSDLCVMLLMTAGNLSLKLPEICEANEFADTAKIPDYARLAVSILNQAEIVSGKPGNLFDPKGKTTRAEAAVMFSEFVKKSETQNFDLLTKNGYSFGGLLIESQRVIDIKEGKLGFGLRYDFIPTQPDRIEAVITTKKDSFEIEPMWESFGVVTMHEYTLCHSLWDIDVEQGENIVLELTVYYGEESETYTLYLKIPYARNDNPFDV